MSEMDNRYIFRSNGETKGSGSESSDGPIIHDPTILKHSLNDVNSVDQIHHDGDCKKSKGE